MIVQPDVYRAQRQIFRGEPLLVVEGICQQKDGVINVLARRGWPLSRDLASPAVPRHDFH